MPYPSKLLQPLAELQPGQLPVLEPTRGGEGTARAARHTTRRQSVKRGRRTHYTSARCCYCKRQFFPADPNETECRKCTRPIDPDAIKVIVVRDSVRGIDRRAEFGLDTGLIASCAVLYRR
jgi:hypothetical protein